MKNIFWVAATLCVVFIGDRTGGALLDNIATSSQFRYSRMYSGRARCDILLAGNSRGLIYYQPYIEEKTGRSTTNLSYNGMPIELAVPIVKDFIDLNGVPQSLLLDITLLDKRMDRRLTTGFNFYTPYSGRLSQLMCDSFPTDYNAGKITHLYRYNSEVFHRALYYLKKSDKDWLLDRIISSTLQKKVAELEPFYYDFDQDMLAQLKELTGYAQKKGVDVKLIINPYFPPFVKKIKNMEELIAAVEKVTGLKVYNYANSIQGVKGFGDYQHLNKNGAKAFIDILIDDDLLK